MDNFFKVAFDSERVRYSVKGTACLGLDCVSCFEMIIAWKNRFSCWNFSRNSLKKVFFRGNISNYYNLQQAWFKQT